MIRRMKIISGAILLAAIFVSCGRNTADQTPAKKEGSVEVSVLRIEATDGAGSRSYVGSIKASKSAKIAVKHSGVLKKLNVSQGSYVGKGEVVAEISSEMVKSAQATASATFEYAKDAWKRASQVKDAGGITEQKLVEIKTEYDKARAALRGANQALEECKLKAPFAGVIGDVLVELGENLDALTPVATIMDISSLQIEFSVPESEIASVKVGDVMEVRIPALDGKSVSARVTSRGIVASPVSHTYICTLVPSEKIDGMLPGMVCSVRMATGEKSLVVVPATSVKTDTEGRYVWIAENGRVAKRYVAVSGYSGNNVVVGEGLVDGDLVITSGMNRVSTGMIVKIVSE